MSEYTEYWPGGGEVEKFVAATEDAVARFKGRPEPLSPRKINAELSRLRSALENLSPETRAHILSYEIVPQHEAAPQENFSFVTMFDRFNGVVGEGSCVERLEKIVANKFSSRTQRDAIKRRDLIFQAGFIYKAHGGKVEAREKSPFVKYLQHLFGDVGMENADVPKAVRDLISKGGT